MPNGNGSNRIVISIVADTAAAEAAINRLGQTAAASGQNISQSFSQGANGAQRAAQGFQQVGQAANQMAQGAQHAANSIKEIRLEVFENTVGRVKGQLTDFRNHLVGMAASFVGIAGAWEMVKHAFERGEVAEETRVRFQNLVGATEQANTAFHEMQGTARETGISMREIAESAESLYASGENIDTLSEKMENLAKISAITGTDLETLTELIERMRLHGDVTFRELFRLTQATGGITREWALQYRDLPRILEASKGALDAIAKMQQSAFEGAEKYHSAVEAMAEKGGLAARVFADWKNSVGSLYLGLQNLPQINMGELIGIRGQFGPWGQRAAQELWTSLNNSIQQISHETGISIPSIKAMVSQGFFTQGELLQKASEWRKTLNDMSQASIEATKGMISAQVQQQQFAILDNIMRKLNETAAIQQKFADVAETWGHKIQVMGANVQRAFGQAGTAMINALKPALDLLERGDWLGAWTKLPPVVKLATDAVIAFEAVLLTGKIINALTSIAGLWGKIRLAIEGATLAEGAFAGAGAAGGAARVAGGAAAEGIGGSIVRTLLVGAPGIGQAIALPIILGIHEATEAYAWSREHAQQIIDESRARTARGGTVATQAGAGFPDSPEMRAYRQTLEQRGLIQTGGGFGVLGSERPGPARQEMMDLRAQAAAQAAAQQQAVAGQIRGQMPQMQDTRSNQFFDRMARVAAEFHEAAVAGKGGDFSQLRDAMSKIESTLSSVKLAQAQMRPEDAEKFQQAINVFTEALKRSVDSLNNLPDDLKDSLLDLGTSLQQGTAAGAGGAPAPGTEGFAAQADQIRQAGKDLSDAMREAVDSVKSASEKVQQQADNVERAEAETQSALFRLYTAKTPQERHEAEIEYRRAVYKEQAEKKILEERELEQREAKEKERQAQAQIATQELHARVQASHQAMEQALGGGAAAAGGVPVYGGPGGGAPQSLGEVAPKMGVDRYGQPTPIPGSRMFGPVQDVPTTTGPGQAEAKGGDAAILSQILGVLQKAFS